MIGTGELLFGAIIVLLLVMYDAVIISKFRTFSLKMRERRMIHNIQKLVIELEKLDKDKKE